MTDEIALTVFMVTWRWQGRYYEIDSDNAIAAHLTGVRLAEQGREEVRVFEAEAPEIDAAAMARIKERVMARLRSDQAMAAFREAAG